MSDIKEKMIELWEQTCKKTSKRHNNKLIDYYNLPENVQRFSGGYYVNYDYLVEKEGYDKSDFSTYDTEKFLYLIFEDEPPLIMRFINITHSGKFKTNTLKEVVNKGFLGIKWTKNVDKEIVYQNHVDEIKKKFSDVKISEDNTTYKVPTKMCSVLMFGNHRVLLSEEETKRLKEAYFEAGKRVDAEIMDKRIKETK